MFIIQSQSQKRGKKNQISNSRFGQKCCDKILKESWKIDCDFPKKFHPRRKNLNGSHGENRKRIILRVAFFFFFSCNTPFK